MLMHCPLMYEASFVQRYAMKLADFIPVGRSPDRYRGPDALLPTLGPMSECPARCLDEAGANGVDRYAVSAEIIGERCGQGIERGRYRGVRGVPPSDVCRLSRKR